MDIHERLIYWTQNVKDGKGLIERVLGPNTPVNSAATRKLNKVIIHGDFYGQQRH